MVSYFELTYLAPSTSHEFLHYLCYVENNLTSQKNAKIIIFAFHLYLETFVCNCFHTLHNNNEMKNIIKEHSN
jgi:hypothetical protein